MDQFWQQDIINEWNDEYSPRKTPRPQRGSSEDTFSPKKSPTKQDRLTKGAKKAFSERKHALASSFLAELDETITDGQISQLSASTGGVKIIWSKKLHTTAGRANWKRETLKSTLSNPSITYRHHAAIELAEKVIDDEDRLLNVIAHEFCHLANFMISGIKTNPHGKEFKAWAAKVSMRFGERGIEVQTKHSYEIEYKYVWECENCGMEFKRHSRSIYVKRHQCGVCKSRLVQTKPVPRVAVESGYQVFVKENMGRVRGEMRGSPQKEVMREVGRRYQEFKAMKVVEVEREESVSVEEVVRSKESSPVDDDVEVVARKLDFLDLISP
jgi:predicted SprT family Zn-dependent metalloprotease